MRERSVPKIHFIAIGGAAMHNIALALAQNGYKVTGSDDEITEPSRSRLDSAGLLPEKEGWFPEKISADLDAVVLGMHAKKDNPELLRAQQSGLKVYSYPEFLYEHSKNKKRVVIGGSHGKTTITSMILSVLKFCNLDFDYMVGARVEGFDTMVRLSDAPLIILEGDEYLSSPVDLRPKFHLYKADIGLISGIAWDHFNVFPDYSDYQKQFRIFAEMIPANGSLIYCKEDAEVCSILESAEIVCRKLPYSVPPHEISEGLTYLNKADGSRIPLSVFGDHNLLNLEGARLVCELLGVSDHDFSFAISRFKGAARRLELLAMNPQTAVYKDFAHSPSKLRATTDAVRRQFPEKKLIACMELHTFSSLNEKFIGQYSGSMNNADLAIVYYNPKTVEHKKLKELTDEQLKASFGRNDLVVFRDAQLLENYLLSLEALDSVFLMMSSGTFDGMDLDKFAKKITGFADPVSQT
jgi:UDP-N-acetylmuramate: L-alanyl-gamma-D-glutamyl-meso-diaminopimelate ligase